MTAVAATFTSIKHIQGRKVYQLVLEVAQEQIDEALAVLGGMPKSDDPVWVGVARLAKTGRGLAEPLPAVAPPDAEGQGRDKLRQPFHTLPPTTQAVLACKDERFIKWSGAWNETSCADWVRKICGVKSRTQLNEDLDAAHDWRKLYARYRSETGLEAEPR